MSKPELVSIGDTTTDAFIRLHDASVHCDLNHKNCQLCVSFADKVPYEDLTVVPGVGNSANVAVGAARLGHKARFMSAVGDDHYGREIIALFRKEKVDPALVKTNRGAPTNYHFVLNYRGERTILIKHNQYRYYDVNRIGNPEWLFFSSTGEHMLPFHHRLARYLTKRPRIKLGFNPGTFQMKMGRKKLAGIYRQTHVLFVNREEAARVLDAKISAIKKLMRGLHKLGPKIVCITDGPDGAYASEDDTVYFMPIYPDPAPPFERTGAGDAFSSGFMSALMYDLPVAEAMRWAPINSMNVVQYVGAREGLLTKNKLLSLLKRAPKNYRPRLI
ncbi:MAG: carbohydrate kinase family protein [Candidatus Doudnabacteria bacterium]|nr:carbohydrate kinase family protein [Candidatus Doudnabacteria bacterium]